MLVTGIVDAVAFDWEVRLASPKLRPLPRVLTQVSMQVPPAPSPRPAVAAVAPASNVPWYASDPARSTPAGAAAQADGDMFTGQAKRARLEPPSRPLAEELLHKRHSLEGCVS
jgi:hypothetical protein